MDEEKLAERIRTAIARSGKSQRKIAQETGVSQSAISRIVSAQKMPTVPELHLLAEATGYRIDQLTGTAVADRLEYAARSTDGAGMQTMTEKLTYYLELDAYLDEQAVF